MNFNIERQQRNYNYLELIRVYNKTLNKYGEQKDFNKRDFYAFIEKLKGLNTADEIYDALLPDAEDIDNPNKLELFYETEENRYRLAKSQRILPPASKEEAVAVYSMLNSGNLDLYFEKQEVVKSNVLQYFKNINTAPIDINDYIEVKGRSKLRDADSEIKENFKTLQTAIEKNNFVEFRYCKGKEPVWITVFPVKIIFSQLDERYRLKAVCRDNGYKTFYLSLMEELHILNEKAFDFNPITEKKKELVFCFKDERNLAERVCARFSDYKKQIKYSSKDKTITYAVQYDDTPLENNRIINRLLSLGRHIDIKSEEKAIIKERAKKALAQYSGTNSGK